MVKMAQMLVECLEVGCGIDASGITITSNTFGDDESRHHKPKSRHQMIMTVTI